MKIPISDLVIALNSIKLPHEPHQRLMIIIRAPVNSINDINSKIPPLMEFKTLELMSKRKLHPKHNNDLYEWEIQDL